VLRGAPWSRLRESTRVAREFSRCAVLCCAGRVSFAAALRCAVPALCCAGRASLHCCAALCRGTKPPPPGTGRIADLPLYAALYRDGVSLYRDMSGASLHRRGYRDRMHRAALNEAAAAGMLMLAGWPQLAAVKPGGRRLGLGFRV
jgi:23S rRNA G2445 N2-methylase RlmL